jgi:hypothetical protein
MATVCEYTTEEQRSSVRFCGQNDSAQRIFINNFFLVYGGKSLSCKAVHRCVKKGGKRFADDEGVETEVRKWLRQHSKEFYAEGFDALIKRWDKCIDVGGGYVEK